MSQRVLFVKRKVPDRRFSSKLIKFFPIYGKEKILFSTGEFRS